MTKYVLSNDEITMRCAEIATDLPPHSLIYGVPRGGVAPAYYIAASIGGGVVDSPALADFIVDDIVDSGRTRALYENRFPKKPFIAVVDKQEDYPNHWVVFPWEVQHDGHDTSHEDVFVRLLEYIGEDPNREGLLETPKRMAAMWREVTSGYNQRATDFFKTFTEQAPEYDQMVILDPIPYYSMCEHHLLPFFGTVSIAYIPGTRFAGLSKFARVVDMYSRRLQIQERMTHQIAKCIVDHVQPQGVAVVVKGRHMCMEMRGVEKPCVNTTTSAVKGVFFKDPKARNEFLHLIVR